MKFSKSVPISKNPDKIQLKAEVFCDSCLGTAALVD